MVVRTLSELVAMTDAELAGVIVGALALLVTVIGIVLVVVVERLKRSRLEIETADWPYQRPWEFAVVHVFNRSNMPRGFGFLICTPSASLPRFVVRCKG